MLGEPIGSKLVSSKFCMLKQGTITETLFSQHGFTNAPAPSKPDLLRKNCLVADLGGFYEATRALCS